MAVKLVSPARPRLLSVDEWVRHPAADQYELIDGFLRTRMVNQNYHEFAVGRLGYVLNEYLLRPGIIGRALSSNTKYRVRARRGIMPDFSVVMGQKARGMVRDAAYNTVGPDVAMEVLSPDQGADYIEERLDDYWKLGTAEVWIIDPQSEKVTRYTRGDQGYTIFATAQHDEEFGSRFLDGLRFSVSLLWMRDL